MKTNLLVKTYLVFLLLITVAGTVFAQTATAGVTKGNTFDYDYNILWESNDPKASPPAEYVDLNYTQWFRISIADVGAFLITVQTTLHLKNGTENTKTGSVNVDEQTINVPFGFLLIRANSNPNEKIYPGGDYAATINETVLRTYPNGQRQTSHYITETTKGNTYEKTETFFDRATGVAVESQYESRETSGSYITTTKETITIKSSNVWTIPEFPTYAILLILTFTSLFIALYVKKLRASGTDKGRAVLSCTHYVHSRTRDASAISLPS
jgi:hypothetical protein